uniref:Uncharacterized protein n=1 Tax=Anguilla anguilla TaxID=7936 RepID=A0A0E9SDB2_ANGAN
MSQWVKAFFSHLHFFTHHRVPFKIFSN